MESRTEHIQYLWQQYVAKKATAEEVKELYKIIGDPSNDADNLRFFHIEMEKYPPGEKVMEEEVRAGMLQQILQAGKDNQQPAAVPAVHRIHFLKTAWFRYAAILLLIAGAAVFYVRDHASQKQSIQVHKTFYPENDIQPGGNRATLTLADGRRIILDSAADGDIAQQGISKVIKLNNNQLSYHKDPKAGPVNEVIYNTISTPRGGQYQIILPDGSRVWLNAASSLRFPTAFRGTERHVELSGEAYFEIEEDKSMPFMVSSDRMKVQVLGTHFNINSYHDEPVIKTTLLTGSIRLFHGSEEQLVKPGQQVLIAKDRNKLNVISNADIEEAMAWKNGYVLMKGADIPTIMRQISRWYDVEIRYKGNVPQNTLGGRLPRNATVSQILKILVLYNIHSSIEGKVITINPDAGK